MNDCPSQSTRPSEFSYWYETPIFETGIDEHLEAMATSGRGPIHLAANVLVKADARTAWFRSARHRPLD
jgi:hypothetical protein